MAVPAALLPADEQARLAALRRYAILDTPPEETFDRVAQLAAQIFAAPIALVTFIDQSRQWIKARLGFDMVQCSREIAFCSYTILEEKVFIVFDARKDARFSQNPLVTGPPHIRFYAGAPLRTHDGRRLGSLCIIDTKARSEFTAPDRDKLQALATIVMDELELRLARARALLLANLSHEFRTPLNAVVGFADLMRRELRGPIGRDEYREYVKDIHDSGVHLLGLVDDLLDLAGTEPNRLRLNEEELDLERLVTGVVRLLGVVADQRQVIVSTELHPAVPRLQGDGRRLTQVLLNLLSNALKFTPAGGNVRITSSPSADGGCTLAISDTGVGMSPDTVAKLGQPYPVDTASAQSPKHSGLGLPICRELVEMHGGRLEIKSKVGLGTTVSIHLPRERVIPTAVGCDSI